MDLEFLCQFAFLEGTDVGRLTNLGLVKKLFQNLKFMQTFSFERPESENSRKSTLYAVQKEAGGFKNQKIYPPKYFKNLDDLLQQCDRLSLTV